jgi:leucyl aminopeptidase
VSIGFSGVVSPLEADVVIIVVASHDEEYVLSEIKKIKQDSVPKDKLQKLKDQKYKDAICFDIVQNEKTTKVIVLCAGEEDKITDVSIEKLGGFACNYLPEECCSVIVKTNIEHLKKNSMALFANGIVLKSWVFDKYKTKKKHEPKTILCETQYTNENKEYFCHLQQINEGVSLAKAMISEPANVMTPDKVLEECQRLKHLGVEISCLGIEEMAELGMSAVVGVSLGSDKPAYVVTLGYQTDKSQEAIVLVGKGLTFDSGGLCLKPAKNMGEMKTDMSGAAAVVGTIKALALQRASCNVVGVIGVVENSISGKAQRPGDVVTSMSGKTIEVDNTDAEGRLVLADCLWYAAQKFAPSIMIDVATLTGAIEIALGREFAGLFSNDDDLAKTLQAAGRQVGEKLWPLPMHQSYEKDIESDIADVKNTGCGRGAGSITAAIFLKKFVQDDIKWAHLDIAATATDSIDRALSKKGATGFGVRLLTEFITNQAK